MQQEKDFIQREIQRLTLLLNKLIGKALGLDIDGFDQGIQNIESDLKSEFDLSLREILEMENSELIAHIRELDEQHLEKIAELISILIKNPKTENRNQLAKKGIVLLYFLDSHSKTFSLKRMELKNTLRDRTD